MEELKSHYSKKIEEMRQFYEDTIEKLETQIKSYESRPEEEDEYRVRFSLFTFFSYLFHCKKIKYFQKMFVLT